MISFFRVGATDSIAIELIQKKSWSDAKLNLSESEQSWVSVNHFTASPGSICILPDASGKIARVLLGVDGLNDFWNGAHAACRLPAANYHIATTLTEEQQQQFAIAWGLQTYRFTRYKSNDDAQACLSLPHTSMLNSVTNTVEAIYLTRDLINTPCEDMGPSHLASAAEKLAQQFNAELTVIIGDDLLTQHYPAVHMVGRAASNAPRLIDITWGNDTHPKITLVGKGVCFDTGGLDIKDANSMLLMKKDMGGAAHVLGLASLIMAEKLPIRLRVLIPAVENAIGGNAFRPGDVMATRKGTTVEIGNTDAEGRLVLADALYEAQSERPECIIDFATLTGAMRVALGTDIAGYFSNSDTWSAQLEKHAAQCQDPVWRMPLYQPYRKSIDGKIADLNNVGGGSYAGGIIAALFLREFVGDTPWIHFDVMAWNLVTQPGRREGGEALALRATFGLIKDYCS